jgi:hypothetical protein
MALPGAGAARRNVEGRRNGRASNGVRWDSFPKVKVGKISIQNFLQNKNKI